MTLHDRFVRAHARLKTIATTGTNGKTSTTTFVASIIAQTGPSAKLTTLGAEVDGRAIGGTGTEQFLATVEAAVAASVSILALEMTSKSLAGGLAFRWRPDVAVFTNLSHDHLDYHPSPEAYLAAKAQLFLALPAGGVAVLNREDPASALLAEIVPKHATVRWYGDGTADGDNDLQLDAIEYAGEGLIVHLVDSPLARALGGELRLQVSGGFQAYNALGAALAADCLGIDPAHIAVGLQQVRGVPGRFQIVHSEPTVVVDFAHTPDALEKVLGSARRLVGSEGRLHCVFGCGGDRDPSKRAPMGALVDRLADVAWLTSDNPRSEDPERIADEVLAGRGNAAENHGVEDEESEPEAPGAKEPRGEVKGPAAWHRTLDRKAAIHAALTAAAPTDVVVVAGKGHEATQTIGEKTLPFDDVQVVRDFYAHHAD